MRLARSGLLVIVPAAATVRHQTSLDVYETLIADDLKAAAVIATFAEQAAMGTERLPGKTP